MREQKLVKTTLVRIEPVGKDEWKEEAECLNVNEVQLMMCSLCPVVGDCAALHDELVDSVGCAVSGIWGGVRYDNSVPQRTNSGGGRYAAGSAPVNGGLCACGQPAYRRGKCNKCYRKALKERE